MATTDEDLQKKQKTVVNLRQKVADANAKREANEHSLVNDITAAALDAEAAGLEVELENAQRLSKMSTIKSSTPDAQQVPVVLPAVTDK